MGGPHHYVDLDGKRNGFCYCQTAFKRLIFVTSGGSLTSNER